MNDKEYLENKRLEVLERIKPMCNAFGIFDYDYEVENGEEYLRLEGTRIGCSCNSIGTVVQEVVGFIFIHYWDRTLGYFGKFAKREIKKYWEEI